MASATPLPSGVNPPLTTDNDDNHGGLVVIMTSLALVLVLASLAARIFSAVQRHIFQRDDLLFGILVVGWSLSSHPLAVLEHPAKHYPFPLREHLLIIL